MKLLVLSLAFLSLVPKGCQTTPLPPPSNVASAPALGVAEDSKDSKIAAHAEAADFASDSISEANIKASVKGPISVIRSLSGPATDKDRAEAMALVVKAQSGKLADAQAGWAKARQDAEALTSKIAALEQKVELERIKAKEDLQKKVSELEGKAEAERKRIMTFIFAGLGALGVASGVVILVLSANPVAAASYAFLGPKAGFAAIGAGLSLIAIGIAVNAAERLIESHPYFFGSAIAAALGLAGIAGVLIWSNHHHHVSTAAK